jgi:replicative DNA helicase
VIALSKLNRELEKDKSRRPPPDDLRESGAIEPDADLAGRLCNPDASYDEDGPDDGEDAAVNLLTTKQRNGPTGDVNLRFLKIYTRFESATKVSDEDLPG